MVAANPLLSKAKQSPVIKQGGRKHAPYAGAVLLRPLWERGSADAICAGREHAISSFSSAEGSSAHLSPNDKADAQWMYLTPLHFYR